MVIFSALLNSGCDVKPEPAEMPRSERPVFSTMYDILRDEETRVDVVADEEKITFSTSGMSLIEFLRYVADVAKISIVCDQSLDNQIVNVNVVNAGIRDVLSSVARRYGVDITQQGSVYYIGTLKPQDRALLVRKVKRLRSDDIVKMISALISEVGKVASSPDGLTVVGDRVQVLRNINSMIDQIEAARANTWVAQLYMITGSTIASRELGFDTTATLDVAAILANSKSNVEALGAFNAVLRAARSNSGHSVLAEPMLLLTDGGSGSIRDGERIPIPRKVVSDNGTVTTVGYEYVNTGVNVTVNIREMSSRSASCGVKIVMDQVTSYVEGTVPVTSGQTFETQAVVDSGGTYLLGSLTRKSSLREKGGAFINTYKSNKDDGGIVEVWLRCYRIGGGVPSSEASLPAPSSASTK